MTTSGRAGRTILLIFSVLLVVTGCGGGNGASEPGPGPTSASPTGDDEFNRGEVGWATVEIEGRTYEFAIKQFSCSASRLGEYYASSGVVEQAEQAFDLRTPHDLDVWDFRDSHRMYLRDGDNWVYVQGETGYESRVDTGTRIETLVIDGPRARGTFLGYRARGPLPPEIPENLDDSTLVRGSFEVECNS